MVKFKLPIKNILGLSYYRYNLSSNNYNPPYNSTITISCQCTNVFGNPVKNKELTLYKNGSSEGTATTDTTGTATWTVTVTTEGINQYRVSNENLTINANRWKLEDINISYARLYVNEKIRMCHLNYYRQFGSATADTFYTWHSGGIPSDYRPPLQCNGSLNQVGVLYVDANGDIGGKFANSFSSSRNVSGSVIWHY